MKESSNKKELRKQIRASAAAIPEARRAESDAALTARFLSLPELSAAQTLLVFYGVGTEPDTKVLIEKLQRAHKTVCLPCCLPEHRMVCRTVQGTDALVTNAYGIPEPDSSCPVVEKDRLDFVLVPALCYDRTGMRLGQGGGYYDRFLSDFRGLRVGLCRDVLLQEKLPSEPHDIGVQIVLTETELLRF